MQVLWVEDQVEDNRGYVEALEASGDGIDISYATSVCEAIDLLKSAQPDLLVLDLNIPLGREAPAEMLDDEVNGNRVLEWLGESEEHRGLKVVCFTNFFDRAGAARARGALVVRKGVFVSEFLKAVKSES